ncbi:MAG: hypothetical protein DMF91_05895, partial [Acidobacteria bacterium]
PLHEQTCTAGIVGHCRPVGVPFGLLQPRERMMRDLAALHGRGMDFNRAHPPRFGQTRFDNRFVPRVERDGGHRVGRRFDDEIGLAELRGKIPDRFIRPLLRWRHVLGVAFGRARIDPPHQRVDLVVGQRPIVLELLNPDGLVDVPRRHLPRRHARLDRSSPRPGLFVRYQRHRCDVAVAVARLTFVLEDRRDVSREGGNRRRMFVWADGRGSRDGTGGDHWGQNGNKLPRRVHRYRLLRACPTLYAKPHPSRQSLFTCTLSLRDRIPVRRPYTPGVSVRIHERTEGGVYVLDVEGPITYSDGASVLRTRVNSLVQNGYTHLLVNVGGVPYLDSAGLGELVQAHITTLRRGGAFKIVNATRRLRDLLVMTKLMSVFENFDDEAVALASFRES